MVNKRNGRGFFGKVDGWCVVHYKGFLIPNFCTLRPWHKPQQRTYNDIQSETYANEDTSLLPVADWRKTAHNPGGLPMRCLSSTVKSM
jgi:hypothetical protein